MSPRVMEIRSRIEPVLIAHGLDLEDLSVSHVGRRDVVRVIVDRDGGVDLDSIAEVSNAMSTVLDEAAFLFPHAYVLEVSSPGVDRPLTAPRHWRRAQGRLVSVRLRTGETVHGRVVGVEDTRATLRVDGGDDVAVAFADVESATIEIEFSRGQEDD
jgi:ribosome maturation factor RimP